jgi:hypothetical protein
VEGGHEQKLEYYGTLKIKKKQEDSKLWSKQLN